MLGQGLLLMVAGTGTVFVFLCLMVIVMMAVGAYFKANESRYTDPVPARESTNGTGLPAVVAAIAVALQDS